jgi:hypothetical protein
MRFYNFLNENDSATFLKECAPFIEEYTKAKAPLLRGVSDSFKIKKVKTSEFRLPRDMALFSSQYVDNIYQESLGVPLRSTGVFCTKNEKMANIYGTAYAIFPVGKYTLYQNPLIRDMFVDVFAAAGKATLCEPGKMFDPIAILNATVGENGLKANMKDQIITNTAKRHLNPYTLTLTEKTTTFNKAIIEDNLISDKLVAGPGTITATKAIEVFWSYAFEIMEDKLIELLKKTKQVSLSSANSVNEIILTCYSYYLIKPEWVNKWLQL